MEDTQPDDQWEYVSADVGEPSTAITKRLRVPEGWIYSQEIRVGNRHDLNVRPAVGLCFVPDPEHEVQRYKALAEWLRDGLDAIATSIRDNAR